MGVTLECKKTGSEIDLGYGGFMRLREKVAELVGDPFYSVYHKLLHTDHFLLPDGSREKFCVDIGNDINELVAAKQADKKIVDFLMQPDSDGKISYGTCKNILKVIGNYDDDILYGYSGKPDCAKFRDFKKILQDCVEHKCSMCWS